MNKCKSFEVAGVQLKQTNETVKATQDHSNK